MSASLQTEHRPRSAGAAALLRWALSETLRFSNKWRNGGVLVPRAGVTTCPSQFKHLNV
ncbi:hypothetical protein Nmel_007927 [Mimus melanotis]